MTAALERRIAAIEDIEAIRRVKYRYWLSLDRKQWDTLERFFADDAVTHYPRHGATQGRSEIVQCIRASVEGQVTPHHGHNPDIELTDPATARGVWDDAGPPVLPHHARTRLDFWFYEDECVKINAEWKISILQLVRIFPERADMDM